MGVKQNEYRFLKIMRESLGNFGDVLTLGKQQIYTLERNEEIDATSKRFLDELLVEEFGAASVNSIDYSKYEGADIIQNLAEEVSTDLDSKFDLVIDFGTIEHIFNVEQAFKNCIKLVKKGGWIVHANPSNNSNGHGFYQLSPELFLSIYSEANGFSKTKVFVVDMSRNGKWYEVRNNQLGDRINLISRNETYVFCMTQVIDKPMKLNVFQSDYQKHWNGGGNLSLTRETNKKSRFVWKVKRYLLRAPILMALRENYFKRHGIIHSVPDASSIKEFR